MAGRGAQKGRSRWWIVHQWAGLKLSLFLSFILLTGTLATLSHEIDWLIDPGLRAYPESTRADGAPSASWGQLMDAAKAAAPGARIERLSAPYSGWFAAEAIVLDTNGERFRIYMNPETAQVQDTASWFNAQRLFRELHRHLMLPTRIGIPIVAFLSIPMLASFITAFVVYKKWWRGFFRLPKWRPGRRGEGRRFTGDLHRFAGLWCLWFVGLIGITGLWYLIEWGGGNARPAPRPKAAIAAANPDGAALDTLVATAQAAYPNLRITSVYFPPKKPGGVVVMGQADAWLVRERANSVWLDADTGAVMQVFRGEDHTVHQRISEAADPLHFGQWAGFGVRLIWFLFGLVLTGLAVSGVVIYWLRIAPADRAGVRTAGFMRATWQGMGRFGYAAMLATLVGLCLATLAVFQQI
ncbi:MAG: peptidase [Alphaproteobacteria bacterium]|nr:MAG: peptidase [Alphaproteobacteria bacterium]